MMFCAYTFSRCSAAFSAIVLLAKNSGRLQKLPALIGGCGNVPVAGEACSRSAEEKIWVFQDLFLLVAMSLFLDASIHSSCSASGQKLPNCLAEVATTIATPTVVVGFAVDQAN